MGVHRNCGSNPVVGQLEPGGKYTVYWSRLFTVVFKLDFFSPTIFVPAQNRQFTVCYSYTRLHTGPSLSFQ